MLQASRLPSPSGVMVQALMFSVEVPPKSNYTWICSLGVTAMISWLPLPTLASSLTQA